MQDPLLEHWSIKGHTTTLTEPQTPKEQPALTKVAPRPSCKYLPLGCAAIRREPAQEHSLTAQAQTPRPCPRPGEVELLCCLSTARILHSAGTSTPSLMMNSAKALTLHQASICSLSDNSSQWIWQPQGLTSTQHQTNSKFFVNVLVKCPKLPEMQNSSPTKKSVLLWSGFVFTCSATRQWSGAGGELLCTSISCFSFWTNHWNWLLYHATVEVKKYNCISV